MAVLTCRLHCATTRKLHPFLSLFAFSSSSSCKRALFPLLQKPPIAKKIPFAASAHEETWQDPYRWMSNIKDPDLSDYLKQENSYAEAFMADTLHLQHQLVAEMKSRMPPKIETPPERWGPWLYYQYFPQGKEYPVLCRRLESGNGWHKKVFNYVKGYGEEEILLDWNQLAEQFGYVHIGTCRVSPDHKFLAYTLDTSGNEFFVLQIKDLRTGNIIQKSRSEGVVSLAWAQDCNTLLYTLSDETQRPYRVLCTKLESHASDTQLFSENDLSCCVDISSTKDGKFITVNSNSRTSSEVYVLDASNPENVLQLVRKRVPGIQYFLEHHHGFFYILTNAPLEDTDLGGNYFLARCRTGDLPLVEWEDIILPGQDAIIEDMDMFNSHLLLFLQKKGVSTICSINMPINFDLESVNIDDLDPWFFPLPSTSCSIAPGSNHDFMTHIYRLVLSSPVMPDTIVDYNMLKQKFTIVHREEALGQLGRSANTVIPNMQTDDGMSLHNLEDIWNRSDVSDAYSCVRREVVSFDGVRVPLTILHSRKVQQTGQCPGLLQGYGAYREVLDKSWQADQLSLLDRGWVIAYADVRGGGGGGMSWHQDGTGLSKINSIYDFAACGTYLLNEGFVHRNRLCAIGYSAGGLLVSAAANMYPDLFSAAILKVPFLDICNTLLDPGLPLTTLDYEEFGDPRIESQFKSIHSYSPYDNIPIGVCLPSMLVTTSFHDSRVGVWEGAKWVAKVREKTCANCSGSIILKTNMNGGHFGEGGRYKHCEEVAFEYAFLIKVMGMLNDKSSQGS